MKELSIFIDESGDFGDYDPKSPFYIIGIVAHNQDNDIAGHIHNLDKTLKNTTLKRNFIHVGPLIRREAEYKYMTITERRRILWRLIKFTTKTDLLFKTFYIEKKHIGDDYEMITKLARQLSDFIKQHYSFFLSFDTIKLYYDNGQAGVMKIIISVFTTLFDNVKYKKSLQKDYKLLQVADLVCTARLTELKMERKSLSRSERNILGSDKEIKKALLKPLKRKEFKD
ncbi:DUF3800 domain-containing protein [Candidatus Saccharibacteria bacterium]|nr:DUF3800 domain-containing protein [Candidatus Saccharibacteria bacterium]